MIPEALPSSKLGTKEHWDSVYSREVDNYDQIGDEGEVWFGEEAVERMVKFVEEAREERLFPETPSVLDVGTGNGHLLFELLDISPPFTQPSHMLGIDYSAPSIDLCKRIAQSRGEEARLVDFQVVDILEDCAKLQTQRWDLVCDKGTFDAIALSTSAHGSKDPVSLYTDSIVKICQPGSLFLITSCNFTEQELIGIFSLGFSVHHIIPTPSFSFVSNYFQEEHSFESLTHLLFRRAGTKDQPQRRLLSVDSLLDALVPYHDECIEIVQMT